MVPLHSVHSLGLHRELHHAGGVVLLTKSLHFHHAGGGAGPLRHSPGEAHLRALWRLLLRPHNDDCYLLLSGEETLRQGQRSD